MSRLKLHTMFTGYDREVAMGVINESGYPWKVLSVYNYEGARDNYKRLPSQVNNNKTLLYRASKPHEPADIDMGACGVIAIYIQGLDKTLAVAYSAAYYDRNLHGGKSRSTQSNCSPPMLSETPNWWNIKIYPGKWLPDYSTYKELYFLERPFEGDSKWHNRSLDSGLKIKGAMSNDGQATLEMHVSRVQ
ncbi:DELTA-actitoxin-Ate1a [Exaiptasia diaphana]|uniref:Actinoporin n=5 Tax=Exaiptasia diaphana TaxID=2652724 RepID=A0A913X0R2_EXADI